VVVADDTPERLGDRGNLPTRITFHVPPGGLSPEAVGIEGITVEPGVHGEPATAGFESDSPTADLARLTGWAVEAGIELESLEVKRPTLEDVYLDLTSR
jgi:ABC-2 type transport system ATP-binding protein